MKNTRLISCLLAASLLLSACGSAAVPETGLPEATPRPEALSSAVIPEASAAPTDETMFTDRDRNAWYEEAGAVRIALMGDAIACDAETVQVSGTKAVITGEGTYLLSGTLNDGQIIVDAGKKDKLQLVLDGVSITSRTSAPLYVRQADKVFVTLAEGTENALSNGGSFVAVDENRIDAALFSKQDLTLNGSGRLTVDSPAGHGIVSKDDLVLTGGDYVILAASHGLQAKDSVRITGAALAITAGKDGVHAENGDDESLGFVYISGGTLGINAEGDGISAGAAMYIEGGEFTITAGGGSANASRQSSDPWDSFSGHGRDHGSSVTEAAENSVSQKGLKAGGSLILRGGSFVIDAADDAVHSDASIAVDGGSFDIATGDDGFHADETLTVTAGTIRISESYEGLEALHLDISGGDITLVATDDGLNAAGGNDESGFGGPRGGDRFGGRGGPGGGFSSSSDGSIRISGSTLVITAFGDGIDANGTLEISGGSITVEGPIQGDTSTLDYDVSGVITGGTFIGTGAAAMAQTFSASEQGVIAVRVGNQAAGTQITLKDASGKALLSHTPGLPFAVVILSSPELLSGENYTLTVGASSAEFTAS